MMMQINAPHFTAGVILEDKTVKWAAPIVSYMIGWSLLKMLGYSMKKGWDVIEVQSCPE